jgi:threonine/homoserine/homoserine lactone efflux protein
MNIWLQYVIAFLLLVVGIILLLGRKECIKNENEECIIIKKIRYNPSKQVLGFILGLVNPTVLIYWILVISFLRKKMIHLDISLEYSLLGLFLVGVFLGKVLTLYGYGKFSHTLKLKMKNITTKINRVIGILLVVVSLFQFAKIFFY